MLFNSFLYPLFLSVVTATYWLLPARFRIMFLIVAGCVFFAVSDLHSFVLMLLLAGITWVIGERVRRGNRTLAFAGIAFMVLTLIFFKYTGMLASSFAAVSGVSVPAPSWALPLGISFFVFEFIHYLADYYRGLIPTHKFRDFIAFSFFFPTLVSGPIKRFQAFESSLIDARFQPAMFWTGIVWIMVGYAQKYLIADPLIPFTSVLAHPQAIATQLAAAGGLFLYSIRIYADFAGLSNIAIGSALLLGILVPKNFHFPYLSPDIQQFWRRWHMSLGSWIRDYLYIPLGGNRVGFVRQLLNLLVVMVVVGLWHGAAWNFAAWGLYHGMGLVAHRLWRLYVPAMPKALGIPLTFIFVTIGWAFFATSSLNDSFLLLGKIFG